MPRRRDNGLPAASWVAIADLDVVLVVHVLDLLYDARIPAYTEPSLGQTGMDSLVAPVPSHPIERLWVDPSRAEQTRELLHQHLPELKAEVMRHTPVSDEAWAGIVAAYSASPNEASPRWPNSEDVEGPKPEVEDADLLGQVYGLGDAPPHPASGTSATGFEEFIAGPKPEPADPGDHFDPPQPAPLPTGDPVTRAAWVALVSGPLFLIITTILGDGPGGLSGLIAVALFVGGFVTLVARMRDSRDDDGPDDGAVI